MPRAQVVSQVTPLLGHIWMFPEQQPAMYNRVRFIYGEMLKRAVPRMLPKELVQVGVGLEQCSSWGGVPAV
jgi:hypothetical protein